jgi:aminoglycoside phosphotransferase (APT) family kinase protein
MPNPKITVDLAEKLIAQQFPHWSSLIITPVEKSGWDNRTFHLGTKLLIRMPSSAEYALQVTKEQKWLPKLAPYLSVPIPKPLAQGNPTKDYPWGWSVYEWIDGESASISRIDHLEIFAADLAQILMQLQKIDPSYGPLPGAHNFYRGAHLSVYDNETKIAINQLRDFIDVGLISAIWEKAISSSWHKPPVWIHGDFSASNILIKHGRLAAIIDFGCMGIGDPACDLVISWTFLTKESRNVFKELLDLDEDTWARARGWALWKSLITLVRFKDYNCPEA